LMMREIRSMAKERHVSNTCGPVPLLLVKQDSNMGSCLEMIQ